MKISIRDITSITLIKNSASMMAIHAHKTNDFIIESLRRTEIVVFLINICDNLGIQRPKIVHSNGLKFANSNL